MPFIQSGLIMGKSETRKKKKTDDFIDDGRVIANMNIDGVPQSPFRSLLRQKRTAFDEFGKTGEEKEQVKLTRKERREVILGVILSHLLFIAIVFGGFALFILFCIKVWFKY